MAARAVPAPRHRGHCCDRRRPRGRCVPGRTAGLVTWPGSRGAHASAGGPPCAQATLHVGGPRQWVSELHATCAGTFWKAAGSPRYVSPPRHPVPHAPSPRVTTRTIAASRAAAAGSVTHGPEPDTQTSQRRHPKARGGEPGHTLRGGAGRAARWLGGLWGPHGGRRTGWDRDGEKRHPGWSQRRPQPGPREGRQAAAPQRGPDLGRGAGLRARRPLVTGPAPPTLWSRLGRSAQPPPHGLQSVSGDRKGWDGTFKGTG